jgi:hypothetical protein
VIRTPLEAVRRDLAGCCNMDVIITADGRLARLRGEMLEYPGWTIGREVRG